MKTIFYFYSPLSSSMFGVLLDEAKKMITKNSSEIYFVMCEEFLDSCLANPTGNLGICSLCKSLTKKTIREQLGNDVTILNLKDYYNPNLSSYEVNYKDSKELKLLKYRNVSIGYSTLSTYIHLTRNHQPKIDNISKKYFDSQLLQAMRLIDAFSNIVDEIKPDKIASFNGRFNEVRPVYEVAKTKGVEIDLFEFEPIKNDSYAKVVFKNMLPHSVKGNAWRFDSCWNDPKLKLGENALLAKAFFENRRNGIAAGDKVYTDQQKKGLLPSNWDDSKKNIVIFNSSEDEYIAIGDEYVELALFPDQYLGLEYIFNAHKNDTETHFYLRIHPNLKSVEYKYHKSLYDFENKFSNVTVIGAEDQISSYELLDSSEKVIVFGSTIGLESVYWGKPVILLGCAWYYYSDICYLPSTKEELSEMILKSLEPKYNENVLKQGLFHFYRNSTFIDSNPSFKHINFNPVKINIFNKTIIGYAYKKILGSVTLYAIYIAIIKFLSLKFSKNKFTLPLQDE